MVTLVSSFLVKAVALIFFSCGFYGLVVAWLNLLERQTERRKRRRAYGAFDPRSISYLASSIDDDGGRRSQFSHVKRFLRQHGDELPYEDRSRQAR